VLSPSSWLKFDKTDYSAPKLEDQHLNIPFIYTCKLSYVAADGFPLFDDMIKNEMFKILAEKMKSNSAFQ
jgi:hypothetical protein